MSYLHEIFHAVKCDRCGETHEGYEGYEYHADEQDAWESAQGDDWIEVDGKHYCPLCYHEENDENVPLKPLPPIYRTARTACSKLGTIPHIEFLDDGIKITSGEVKNKKLVEGVIDWIMDQNCYSGTWEAHIEEKNFPISTYYKLVVKIENKE